MFANALDADLIQSVGSDSAGRPILQLQLDPPAAPNVHRLVVFVMHECPNCTLLLRILDEAQQRFAQQRHVLSIFTTDLTRDVHGAAVRHSTGLYAFPAVYAADPATMRLTSWQALTGTQFPYPRSAQDCLHTLVKET